jgi:hypothetical protein
MAIVMRAMAEAKGNFYLMRETLGGAFPDPKIRFPIDAVGNPTKNLDKQPCSVYAKRGTVYAANRLKEAV